MSKKKMLCPKCGKKMTHVAAGWYCMKDDFLIDRVTKAPIIGPEDLIGPSIEEEVERPKRPLGLTVIVILWLLGGLYNLYTTLQIIGTDLQVMPFLSLPTMPEWVRFGVPVELAIGVAGFAVGLAQLITIYGLWTGKSWSYRLALAIPILAVIVWASWAGLYMSAPAEFGLLTGVPVMGLVGSIAYAIVYLGYLREEHVKEYLGVRRIEESRSPSPI